MTYYLDQMGNRMSVRDTGNTKSYNPDNLNEYSVSESNTVTNNDQHQIGLYSYVNYTYRNDEQLIGAARTDNSIIYSLKYDALGRCVARTTSVPGHTPAPIRACCQLRQRQLPEKHHFGVAHDLTRKR